MKFNEVTWYSRLLTVIFLFCAFPIIVFTVGREYQRTIIALDDVIKTLQEGNVQSNTVMTILRAANLEKAAHKIPGVWKSLETSKYILNLFPNNTFTETYDGNKIAWGTWSFRTAVSKDTEVLTPYLEKTYIAGVSGNQHVFFYEIISIDDVKFSIVGLSGGKRSDFEKITALQSGINATTTTKSLIQLIP